MAEEVISVKVDSRKVDAALARLARKSVDLRPAMRRIAGVMVDSVEENFEQEGRPEWPELAASTKKQRRKKGYWPGKILQRSGGLLDSISSDYDEDSAVAGTNKRYAPIQHLGGKAGRGRKVEIPARDFLSLGDDGVEEIVDIIEDHFG